MKVSVEWLAVTASIGFIALLYFGFDTKPPHKPNAAVRSSELDLQTMIEDARKALDIETLKRLDTLDTRSKHVEGDSLVSVLKELSGGWYRAGNSILAGMYATQVAEIENSAASWSIVATTYAGGLQSTESADARKWCFDEARKALENAISLDSENNIYRVNLALLYAEVPPLNEPMKGVQMLLAMNEKNPNDVLVLNSLAKLAVKTGQWEKAKGRLEKSFSIRPDNKTTICLLAEVYRMTQDLREQEMKNKCEFLTLKN